MSGMLVELGVDLGATRINDAGIQEQIEFLFHDVNDFIDFVKGGNMSNDQKTGLLDLADRLEKDHIEITDQVRYVVEDAEGVFQKSFAEREIDLADEFAEKHRFKVVEERSRVVGTRVAGDYTAEQFFHFGLGDSDEGSIGFCASIRARSQGEALERLREKLPEDVMILEKDGEYIQVYLNPGKVTVADIDFHEPVEEIEKVVVKKDEDRKMTERLGAISATLGRGK